MTTASIDLKTALKILGIDSCLGKEEIRKAYLKKALVVHPDKQQQPASSAEAFTRLHNAYCVAMEHCSDHGDETYVIQDDVLMRAFRGEDVDADLRRAGVFRPDPMFGIDVHVPFQSLHELKCDDDATKENMRKTIEELLHE